MLLIGDPSVAKSQLLRYVLYTAPRAIPTTGRGSSGVGLTAAVTTDQETGERRLEAGAMVLADRGVVCIDEFDKMSDIDRTAIHEVMEQGRVTISKAGIHASLNARCSVLAAANPVYGRVSFNRLRFVGKMHGNDSIFSLQYDQYKTPMENIGLQDSLLSRFDLLFVMLDMVDSEHDQRISDFVVRMHRYRNPKEQDGEVLPMGGNYADLLTTLAADTEDKEKATPIYEKYDALLHGDSRARTDQILSVQFMRKYIHMAKCSKPKLTLAASEVIASEYSRLRSQDEKDSDMARTQPVTARTLETLIRLATAHAKARLVKTVSVVDAQAAIELVQYAYFKKVLEKEKRKRRRSEDGRSDGEENDDSDEEVATPQPSTGARKSKRTRTNGDTQDPSTFEYDDMEESQFIQPVDAGDLTQRKTRKSTGPTPSASSTEETPPIGTTSTPDYISEERLTLFKQKLNQTFRDAREQTLALEQLTGAINQNADEPFAQGEINAAVERMSDANQIMVADGMVFLIWFSFFYAYLIIVFKFTTSSIQVEMFSFFFFEVFHESGPSYGFVMQIFD